MRKSTGSSISETAASMVVLLPLLFAVLFVVLEASRAYMIKESLAQSAREASRNLAVAYGQDPTITTNRAGQDVSVFDKIRIHDIINSSAQFEDPTWDTTGAPPTVSVTVDYAGGQYGLPTFPNPDPLKLGKNFHLSATATYRLE